MEEFISISKLSLMINTSVITIRRWYQWYEDESYDKFGLVLPDYYYLDGRKTKFFRKSDVDKIKKFKQKLNSPRYKGAMSEYNAKVVWGNRGKEILQRKEDK